MKKNIIFHTDFFFGLRSNIYIFSHHTLLIKKNRCYRMTWLCLLTCITKFRRLSWNHCMKISYQPHASIGASIPLFFSKLYTLQHMLSIFLPFFPSSFPCKHPCNEEHYNRRDFLDDRMQYALLSPAASLVCNVFRHLINPLGKVSQTLAVITVKMLLPVSLGN